ATRRARRQRDVESHGRGWCDNRYREADGLEQPQLSCQCGHASPLALRSAAPNASAATIRLSWMSQSPGAAYVGLIDVAQHRYQLALHNAPLAASPAASTTEMAGPANIVTPGTKLNTVCNPSKPTRAAGPRAAEPLARVFGADRLWLVIGNVLLQFPDDV